MVANVRLPPILEPTEDSFGKFECSACFNYHHKMMLIHSKGCFRATCAMCIISIVEHSLADNRTPLCPQCRGKLLESERNATSRLQVTRPTPNEQFWLDKVLFKCRDCGDEMLESLAYEHPATCQSRLEQQHHPPPSIPPRGREPFEKCEIVSNPAQSDGIRRPERLLSHHFNGRQTVTRFVRTNHTIRSEQIRLARKAKVSPADITTIKFSHIRCHPDATIGDVAVGPGVTHLAHFTNRTNIAEKLVYLTLEELGSTPDLHEVEVW